jgi:hypothetical protein
MILRSEFILYFSCRVKKYFWQPWTQDLDFIDPQSPNHIRKLKLFLYSLKQAPRACIDCLVNS